MTGPRTKRTRTDVEDPPPSPPADLKKDDELWFDDGNIVLIAKDVGFRIFRSLLEKQSPVFSDMFAFASPRAGEAYDGCPIVHLSDSPEDMRHLLRILIPSTRRRSVDFCFSLIGGSFLAVIIMTQIPDPHFLKHLPLLVSHTSTISKTSCNKPRLFSKNVFRQGFRNTMPHQTVPWLLQRSTSLVLQEPTRCCLGRSMCAAGLEALS